MWPWMCPGSETAWLLFVMQAGTALRGLEAVDNWARLKKFQRNAQTLAQSVMAQLMAAVMSRVIRKQIRNPMEVSPLSYHFQHGILFLKNFGNGKRGGEPLSTVFPCWKCGLVVFRWMFCVWLSAVELQCMDTLPDTTLLLDYSLQIHRQIH